jgi:DNA-binding NtrC family response regulator
MSEAKHQSSDETVRLAKGVDPSSLDAVRPIGAVLVLPGVRGSGGTSVVARGAVVVAGRDATCEIAIDDGSLSRQHARFTYGATLVVEDLGSTNGTRVNGVPLSPHAPHALAAGDEVLLGQARVWVLAATGASSRGPALLVSHERFLVALDEEIARARTFGRPCALALMRVVGASAAELVPSVLSALRPVDRAACFSDDVLELLLCETDGDGAEHVVRAVASETTVVGRTASTVAAYPADATAADALLEAALASLDRAQGDTRRAPSQAAKVVSAPVDNVVDASVARSTAMQSLMATIDKVARTAMPVLLVGETGSGKEVAARLIHERSPRGAHRSAGGPLVVVNCGALPPTLVESTLFGHERGAFTGAVDVHRGVFEAAHGGTVFLDEIGELPAAAQVALLRVLEARAVTRVGATQERAVDARVIAATHRDLDDMVARGTFRQDLLYRLNALTVAVPPLRERADEITALAERFLAEANARHGRTVAGLSDDAKELLMAWRWPGNVRELKNAVERAVVIAAGEVVDVDDLPEAIRRARLSGPAAITGSSGASLSESLEQREIELILEALQKHGHIVADAAVALHMPKRTLQHRMKLLGIQRKTGYGR